MNTVSDAIDKARSDAQDLHKKILDATAKDQTAMKADFASASADAQQVAASLKAATAGQQPQTKQYLNDAAARMQDAASHAKQAAAAAAPELGKAKARVIADVTTGLNNVSYAIASKRSTQGTIR